MLPRLRRLGKFSRKNLNTTEHSVTWSNRHKTGRALLLSFETSFGAD